MTLIYYIAAGLTIFFTLALVLVPLLAQPSAEARHVLDVLDNKRVQVSAQKQTSIANKLLKLSGLLRVRLGFAENPKAKRRLSAAGFRSAGAGDLFFAAQCLAPILGAFIGSFTKENTIFWVCALGMIGYIAPDFWLSRRIEARKKKISRSMPDTIDLLVICVDAGLGLDQALLRVNDELALSHPEIHEELTQVHLEQRAGQARLQAWDNAAKRTAVDEFASFANMLMQTDRFGTPIAKALTRFSEDLRQKRRHRAEEQAAKTKIKILFPLVLCIFPCLFIVLLAPALLSIIQGLHQMNK